jgi:hypothetical protein
MPKSTKPADLVMQDVADELAGDGREAIRLTHSRHSALSPAARSLADERAAGATQG